MQVLLRKPLYLLAPFFAGLYSFIVIRYFSSYSTELLFVSIAISLGALLAFTDYSPLFKLLFLVIPPSLETAIGSGDNKILLPSEPVMILLAIAFAIVVLFRKGIDMTFLTHPVSITILLYLCIMLLGIGASGMLVVSLKYALVSISYVLIFYFMAQDFMRKKESNFYLVYFLYGATILFVALRALYLHSTVGFAHELAGLVVHPYFIDHTIYSACLAILLPGFVVFALKGKQLGLSVFVTYLSALIAFILSAAIFFSYCRAAWISVGAALLFYVLLRLRVKPKVLGIILITGVSLAWLYHDPLIQSLKSNHYTSTDRNSDLTEQTLSVGNISNDASNAERLNRWSCALRMFQDKPLTGFGPGTYQFEYLAYQLPEEMTRISVTSAYNNIYGRGGSAHSEYLLALSEMGIVGFITFTLIIVLIIASGMRAYYRSSEEKTKLLALLALMGFFTYAIHALFNNFLNNNKPASLFWVLAAIIVLMDLKSSRIKSVD
jgi:O-antigen ligase